MQLARTVTFEIGTTDKITGRPLAGLFKVKTFLSIKESLKEDEVRRATLGSNPAGANDYVVALAGAFAYLAVRVVDSPAWWGESRSGLELEDQDVLVEVHNAAVEAIGKEHQKVVDAGLKAQAELKKIPE